MGEVVLEPAGTEDEEVPAATGADDVVVATILLVGGHGCCA